MKHIFLTLMIFVFNTQVFAETDTQVLVENKYLQNFSRQILPYAKMSEASYSRSSRSIDGYTRMTKEQIPTAWQSMYREMKNKDTTPKADTGSIQDSSIAFSATIFQKNNAQEIVVAFKGTELNLFNQNFLSNFDLFSKNIQTVIRMKLYNRNPEHFETALNLVQDLHAKYPSHKIELTGSSLGGAVAKYVALMMGYEAYVFNSLELNAEQIHKIQNEHPEVSVKDSAKRLIKIISVEGDIVASQYFFQSYDYLGRELVIPYTSNGLEFYPHDRHCMGAVLKSLKAVIEKDMEVSYLN